MSIEIKSCNTREVVRPSLRHVILAVTSFCCFCTAVHSRLPIVAVMCLATAMAIISRRPKVSFTGVIGVAFLSFLTSPTYHWTGGYPLAQLQLTFADTSNIPVQKVEMSLDSSDTHMPAPFLLKAYPQLYPKYPLIANSNGSITCLTRDQSFGGTNWYLFWMLPMGRQPSDFAVAVDFDHPKYKEKKVSLFELLHNDIDRYSDFPKVQIRVGTRQTQECPIYSKRIVLQPR